jgi:asparagine synthase (glutamine-hydrolysing)
VCGIAGVLAADARADVGPVLERLTDALAHRGPDGAGIQFLRSRAAGFGHRRLSIVDLVGGAQPMANEDGRVWVVLNGELYNHLDLRRELEAAGHVFLTRADTEVLVHGWEEWGEALLPRLNGMYALALYDGRAAGEVLLARDPVGIKPLYVGRSGDRWWFASELQAARSVGLVAGEPTGEAVAEFLVYRFVPSPRTPFHNAWKVPPGHLLRLPLDGLPAAPAFAPFPTLFAPASLPATADEWEEAVRAALAAAVRRQLMADVPLGTLLSGGVDSTVITGLMSKAAVELPRAFAIGFDRAPDGGELAHARRAAAALGVPLETVSVSEAEYLGAWPAQVASVGEPIANSGVLLVGLLCRRVREQRKVVLTGQGADEPLGGYPRHAAERWYPIARWGLPALALLPERLAGTDNVARMRRVAGQSEEARRFAEVLAVFGPGEAVGLLREPMDAGALADPVRRALAFVDDRDRVNRLLAVDARLSLADDLLIVADHMSMAASVEARVPFLDLEFLALVVRMPSRHKVTALGERKVLYRRAVRPLLPPALAAPLAGFGARTGKKLGFTAPLDRWFGTWLVRDADPFLTGPDARSPAYLRVEGVRRLLDEARRGLPRTRQLLSLWVLEHWLRAKVGGDDGR